MQQLMTHASMALCFSHPAFLPYAQDRQTGELSSIIYHLNQQISLMDKEVGCPFKAISYSGKIKQDPDGVLNWEMIIDV
jgi:hypothetical protein